MTRYLTVAELKDYVRTELTVDDAFWDDAIETAEELLDSAAGRKFVLADAVASTARIYPPSNGCLLVIDDAAAIVSVVDNGATLVSGTDYQAIPLNGLSSAGAPLPYYGLRRLGYYYNRWYNWFGVPGAATITVTARWGWPAIPPLIKEACKIVAKDVFLQRDTTGFGLVAITEAGGIGTRENWVVRKAIDAYAHPNSIATP